MEDRLEEIKQIVEQMPNDPFPRYGLAMEYKTSGNLQAADETFRDLAQRHPAYVPQYLMHGQVLVALQRPDEARAALQAGIAAAQRAGNAHALGELRSALDAIDRGRPDGDDDDD